jgi:hypothetical protein
LGFCRGETRLSAAGRLELQMALDPPNTLIEFIDEYAVPDYR